MLFCCWTLLKLLLGCQLQQMLRNILYHKLASSKFQVGFFCKCGILLACHQPFHHVFFPHWSSIHFWSRILPCVSQQANITQIVAGKFVDLSDPPIWFRRPGHPEPQLLFDDCLMLRSKQRSNAIESMTSYLLLHPSYFTHSLQSVQICWDMLWLSGLWLGSPQPLFTQQLWNADCSFGGSGLPTCMTAYIISCSRSASPDPLGLVMTVGLLLG